MRALILSAALAVATLGMLGAVPSPANAQDWRTTYYPGYGYYYAPAVNYYSPPQASYLPEYRVYSGARVAPNVNIVPVYSTYWPGYTIYRGRTIYYSAPTNVIYTNPPSIYSDYP
jgi:hypothetical protein